VLHGAIGFLSGLVVLWVLAGQQLTDMSAWAHLTVDISAGFTEAMSAEGANRSFEYLAMTVLIAGVGAYAFRNVRPAPTARSSAIRLVLLAAVFWVVLKEAFVRHDAHSTLGFYAVSLVSLAILPRVSKRLLLGGLVAGSVVMTSVAMLASLSAVVDPGPSVKSFFSSFPAVARSSVRVRINDQAANEARRRYRLPEEFVRRIGEAGVHVDPAETSLVWAYGLNWRPVPVFQRYLAFTEHSDVLNARALARSGGPSVVIRERTRGIGVESDEPVAAP
jgi:hypothetical protein